MTEKDVIDATKQHIGQVRHRMFNIMNMLFSKAMGHDRSKLHDPELSTFVEYTPKLATTTYGSEEYKRYLSEMKLALDHHYAENSHHPEHFENGVNGMNLLDIIEMLCDWKAATMRHNDGDIRKSIEVNKERFGVSEQLTDILLNTVSLLEAATPPGVKGEEDGNLL